MFEQDKFQFHGSIKHLAASGYFRNFLRQLFRQDWVVYAKPPFGGAEHVLNYLAHYTHRAAISKHRLVAFENNPSPSDGETMPTAASRRAWSFPPMSSCAASCFTSCPAACT
jgi:hypothetical protein